MSTNIDWSDVIKKEARGLGDADFGEVQDVSEDHVLVQRGLINLEKFNIPKDLAESYDGNVLRFGVSEEEVLEKYRDYSDSMEALSNTDEEKHFNESYSNAQMTMGSNNEIKDSLGIPDVPLKEERLNVSKRIVESNASITKKPVKETQSIQVPVTYEKISIERRRPSESSQTIIQQEPVKSKKKIEIPIKREEVNVKKISYVKEELVIRKKPATETKQVTEDNTSEKLNVSDT